MNTRPALDAGLELFLMEKRGAHLWQKQVDIIRAVFGPRRTTVVQSCTSAGKSYVAGEIAWAWLLGAPGRLVVTTAPTARQVNGHVWTAMRAIAARAKKFGRDMGGKLTPKTAAWTGPSGRSAIGYSSTDPVNYAGWHSSGGVLVIVDDAQGIDDETWDTLQGTLMGQNDRLLALANPIAPSGRFFETCTTRGGDAVNRIRISAFDTPNVVLGRTVIDGMVTREGIESARANYGEDSAAWKARILGLFPDAGEDLVLCPLSWLDRSRQDHALWAARAKEEGESIGVTMAADLASVGLDHGITSILRDWQLRDERAIPFHARIGDSLIQHPKFPLDDTMGTAGYLVTEHKRVKPRSFRVDMNGLGKGIFDRLRELKVPVVGMSGGRASSDPATFANERAEVLYAFREALRPKSKDGGSDDRPIVMLPWNDRLVHQASTLRMSFTSSGAHKMESKKEWSARQKQKGAASSNSPDELDAVAMALCKEPSALGASVGKLIEAYGR